MAAAQLSLDPRARMHRRGEGRFRQLYRNPVIRRSTPMRTSTTNDRHPRHRPPLIGRRRPGRRRFRRRRSRKHEKHEKGGGWLKSRPDVAPVMNATYGQECGSCHMAYQPGLLPALDWARIMGPDALADHYGDDASLSDALRGEIASYLVANSADQGPVRARAPFPSWATPPRTPPFRVSPGPDTS
jgi:hypothetical protein